MPVIRQTRQMFSNTIGVRSFDTGAQQVGRAISDFANVAGREFYERAAKDAEKFGMEQAQSISSEDLMAFNPETGKPEVLSSTDGMGTIAAEAYERVVERRFVDSVDKNIRLTSKDFASKYQDPVQYENMFSAYLDSMAEGADDRFTNIIMDSGSYTMASTKISLADAARRKSREAAAQAVKNANSEFGETIFDTAASGQTEAASLLIQERIEASREAEAAGLYKAGYADKVASDLAVQAMSGALQAVIPNATPLQQASINMYISSQGRAGGDALSEEQLAALDQFIGYVDRENTRSILSESNLISSQVNELRKQQAAEQQAIFEAEAAQFALNYTTGSVMPSRASASKANQDAWSLGEQHFVIGAVNATASRYESERSRLQQARMSDAIGDDEYNSFLQDQRRAGLDSVVINMASDGNIEQLKTAFVTQSPTDIAQLTPLQQAAFQSLQQTALYDPSDDRNYVSSLLSGTQNDVQARIDREIRNANLFTDVDNISTDFLNGSYNPEAVAEAEQKAADALRAGDITASEYDSLTNGVRGAAGKGIANIASNNMSAFEMTALANYVASGGEEMAGVNPFVQTTGEAILAMVPEGQRPSVVNHANSIREKLEKKESIANAELERQQLRATVVSGGGRASNKTHRQVSQEILEELGVDITSPDSKTDAVYSLMRSAPPQNLIDGLNSIGLGLEVAGADVLLDHFAVMVNDPTSTGVFVNRFGSGEGAALSATKTALLQDIVNIRRDTGDSASVIATKLIERRNDPKSDRYVESVFGKGVSPKAYVSERHGEIIAEDLGDTAEYYARIGLEKKEIDAKIDDLVDTLFIKSSVVADPRFPIGVNNRTRYSLEAQFPDEERRDEFTRIINSQLPAGFELARKESNRARTRRAIEAGMEVPKYVYLVPNENSAGASYFAHFVDENNELRALITEINGELTWPLFEEDELTDFDAQRATQRKQEIEQALDEAQRVQDAVDARPGLRSFGEMLDLIRGSE